MVCGMPLLPLSLLMHLDLLKTIGTLLIKTLIDERIRYSTVDQLMQCNAVRKKNPLPRQTREAETDQKDAKHSTACSAVCRASGLATVVVALCQQTVLSKHILEVDYYNTTPHTGQRFWAQNQGLISPGTARPHSARTEA